MSDVQKFHVPDMTCGHCEAAVKTELAKIDGLGDVEVDLTSKIVTVAGGSADEIIAAIDEAGFDAELKA